MICDIRLLRFMTFFIIQSKRNEEIEKKNAQKETKLLKLLHENNKKMQMLHIHYLCSFVIELLIKSN